MLPRPASASRRHARLTSITFAEYEKVSVFVMLWPIVWFNWATSERPGWSQVEPTTGNASSPHRPSLAFVAFQLSCV